MLAAAVLFGVGSDLGIGGDDLTSTLLSPQSLLGALVFALASVTLGWVLAFRHLALALLGAMIWAAGAVAALALLGDGSLGERPAGVVLAAALAVAVEFAVLRPGPRAPGSLPVGLARTGFQVPTP
jgi:hypothetical protein